MGPRAVPPLRRRAELGVLRPRGAPRSRCPAAEWSTLAAARASSPRCCPSSSVRARCSASTARRRCSRRRPPTRGAGRVLPGRRPGDVGGPRRLGRRARQRLAALGARPPGRAGSLGGVAPRARPARRPGARQRRPPVASRGCRGRRRGAVRQRVRGRLAAARRRRRERARARDVRRAPARPGLHRRRPSASRSTATSSPRRPRWWSGCGAARSRASSARCHRTSSTNWSAATGERLLERLGDASPYFYPFKRILLVGRR